MTWKSLRDWLQQNKIVFETVCATCLSAMAVIVSWGQWRVMDLQTRVAEAQAVPRFAGRIELLYDQSAGKYTDARLIASNHGALATEVHARACTFLGVRMPYGGKIQSVELPLVGYFFSSGGSTEGTGDLVRFWGYKNNEAAARLDGQVLALRELATMSLRTILEVSYGDVLQRHHTDYFDVEPVGGSTKLPQDQGGRECSRWQEGPTLDLDKLTGDAVLSAAKSAFSAGR